MKIDYLRLHPSTCHFLGAVKNVKDHPLLSHTKKEGSSKKMQDEFPQKEDIYMLYLNIKSKPKNCGSFVYKNWDKLFAIDIICGGT